MALILVGAAALSALAIYNGCPFFFFDTHAYYTAGEKALGAVLELACDRGLGCAAAVAEAPVQGKASAGSAGGAASVGTIGTGRSPFYGVFLYLAAQGATVWLVVAAQALAVSWLLYLACRHLLGERSSKEFVVVIAVVAALSSAPFFVGYLMPDVFAGLYLLAAGLLIAFHKRLMWLELLALWTLLVCSMLFHRSHVLALALLLGLVGLFVLLGARNHLRRVAPALALIGAAIGIGGLGFVVVDIAVTKITGRVATPPPFLLARIIEDGPGTSYLREACGAERYVVCRFVDRMPIAEDDFLWSKDPGTGVWYVVSPEDRIRIAGEQYTIVLRSFLHAPLSSRVFTRRFLHAPLTQIGAIARNFGQQLRNFGVVEFAATDDLKRFMAASFEGPQADAFMRSRIARDGIDLITLSAAYYLVVLASAVLLLLRSRSLDAGARAVVAIVFAGIALNALVTGTISTPDHRFQARVIWVLPALAAIVALRRQTPPSGAA